MQYRLDKLRSALAEAQLKTLQVWEMSTFLCGTEGIITSGICTRTVSLTLFHFKATDTDIKYNFWPLFLLFYSSQNDKMKRKENQYHTQCAQDDNIQMTHFNLNCISVKQAKGRSKCKRVAFHELAVPWEIRVNAHNPNISFVLNINLTRDILRRPIH